MAGTNNIPRHVAIIMDGNGRWAQERGQERLAGHLKGVESVRLVVEAAREHGVQFLTLYVFSTDNWGRPEQEVSGLMEILCESIVNETESLASNGVSVKIIGDRTAMPAKVREHLDMIERNTAHADQMTLVLALNYGSREEITNAAKNIAIRVAQGSLAVEQIDQETVSQNLYTSDIPDPDLLIRTSGELRLSNFLLWQTAYTEFYFTKTLWPDFGKQEFAQALSEYAGRERRFGQIKKQ